MGEWTSKFFVLFCLISYWENDVWTKTWGGEKSQSYGCLGENHSGSEKSHPKSPEMERCQCGLRDVSIRDEVRKGMGQGGKQAVGDHVREGFSMDVGPYYALRGYSEKLGGHFGITMIGVVLWALVCRQHLCSKYSSVRDTSTQQSILPHFVCL